MLGRAFTTTKNIEVFVAYESNLQVAAILLFGLKYNYVLLVLWLAISLFISVYIFVYLELSFIAMFGLPHLP